MAGANMAAALNSPDDARAKRTKGGGEVAITDKSTKALPQNIEEFNAIAGLAFAQLYKEFPAA